MDEVSVCFCLVTTHLLIRSMIYLDQNVTSRDLGLRSNVDPTFQRYHVYVSTSLDERSTMVPDIGR